MNKTNKTNKTKKMYKSISLLLSTLFFMMTLVTDASALPASLYESQSTETITAGAVREHISRLTENGWLNINVLRIDTTHPNIKIDTLTQDSITQTLDTVPALAQQNNAVAAVNASFFNALSSGCGYADGPTVRSGKLISTAGWYNLRYNDMASLCLSQSGDVIIDYWKNEIRLFGPDASTYTVSQYNQPSRRNYTDITILDPKWGAMTLGALAAYPDLVEIVVSGGQITEVRQGSAPTAIPENGFVIISRGDQAAKLIQSMMIGGQASFSITSSPDWSSLQLAVSGASVLVKDGRIVSNFSFSAASFDKKNPRTLAGCTSDGKQLILVTVDGRQDDSIGLTQRESAELMLQLGAYQAIILDGGGSTTMAARVPGTSQLKVVNVPSEGALRPVANAIGIFSVAPAGTLSELTIETENTNIFVNTSRKFTLRGVDQNGNPVGIDSDAIMWDVTGIKGSFTGSSFRPTSVGNGIITAKIGEVTAQLAITSLSAPARLVLNPSEITIPSGKSQTIKVTGINAEGFAASIMPEDIQWKTSGTIGCCQNGEFQAANPGAGYIQASIGNVRASCAVAVSAEYIQTVYDFENNLGAFTGNSENARGTYDRGSQQVYSGQLAGQLVYDFLYDSVNPSEAAVNFGAQGIVLDKNTVNLALWAYSPSANTNKLMGEVVDASGQKHQILFSGSMQWTGWKQVTASLSTIKSPCNLTRIYVKSTDPANTGGIVYLDGLTATVKNNPVIDKSKIPQDTVMSDKANRKTAFQKGTNNFRFAVFGSNTLPRNTIQQQKLGQVKLSVNKNMDLALFTGTNAAKLTGGITKTVVKTGTGYKTYHYKNSTFIQLDVSKGGLRRTNPQQWLSLFQELKDSNGDHLFITMDGAPSAFINAKEAVLLKDTLADYHEVTGKNVYVFYPGSTDKTELDRGVRYISCAGFTAASAGKQANMVIVTVLGGQVTYELKAL
ncbi:phosphodiester glycosidase family protein [Dehalobacter sp. DCM]|uniref:phosphodiester glycosidase family protein n=1 Tax=Dehalobacter sp. DCM TaxID=2907827 RepID=UPI003081AC35|nr:phosphodiester glycosidase family protein [Dehalobacter sp. DCM]